MAYTRNTHAGVKANVMKRKGHSNRNVRAAVRGNLSQQARKEFEQVLLMYKWYQWLRQHQAMRNAHHQAASTLRTMRANKRPGPSLKTRTNTRSTTRLSPILYTQTPSPLMAKRR